MTEKKSNIRRPAKPPDFHALAVHYIWHDYVDAKSEFEEVGALEKLLAEMYKQGKESNDRT